MAKILVVDDSPTEMYHFVEILTRHGHQVLTATNGAEGIAVAVEEQPAMVLMDVVMPVMNGFHATRHLSRNESTAHIPIVIVSTKNQETDRIWGKRQGATDYFTKPIDENELIELVNRLIS